MWSKPYEDYVLKLKERKKAEEDKKKAQEVLQERMK